MTLGSKLSALQKLSKADLARKQSEHAATLDTEHRNKLGEVTRFFSASMRSIEVDITQYQIPKPIRLPRGILSAMQAVKWSQKDPDPTKDLTPFFFVWADFVAWGQSQGLTLSLVFGHDGVGNESWFSIMTTAPDTN